MLELAGVMAGMPETALEMTARHVKEGLARIARQEALIARVEEMGCHASFLDAARDLLSEMRVFQQMAGSHYAEEKRKAASTSQG
jgi:hypothetical protein